MGKIKKKGTTGAVKNYISRRQALKKLQISLKDFRRLCILKGIYPREPANKKKVNKGSTAPTTWYYRKDIQYLLHEPLLAKFREWKIFARKMARLLTKRQWSTAEALEENKPVFTFDHLIRERYPTFTDALRDLDDALSMIFLFATMPSTNVLKKDLIESCQRKSAEFLHYVIQARCLRKTFISIKGIYYQVEIKGQPITWIVPHQFSQTVPTDVDFKVMHTFLQLYDTLLGFVMFRLYSELNLKYPPALDAAKDAGAAGLDALTLESAGDAKDAAPSAAQAAAASAPKLSAEDKKRLKSLKSKIASIKDTDGDDVTMAEATPDDADEPVAEDFDEAMDADGAAAGEEGDIHSKPLVTYSALSRTLSSKQSLFSSLVFYISREVPRSAVEFVLRAFGATVGWDAVLGAGSPVAADDPRITHHLVDRPSLPESVANLPRRVFVQPQWVFDCVNAGKLLLVAGTEHGTGYAPGDSLPPHLSPFVDETSPLEYNPALSDDEEVEAHEMVEEDAALADSDEEEEDEEDEDEDDADSDDDEDAMEVEEPKKAKKPAAAPAIKKPTAAQKAKAKAAQEEADRLAMAKLMMSNKDKKLFEAIKRTEQKKQDEIKNLKRKKAMISAAKSDKAAPAASATGAKMAKKARTQ
ncbi:mRNA-binding ribosome synthesis protein nop7 [Allomyces arbusculus]|nr:mRNA-binding ribosome synthesis protein nop7 [Allomyces arbusculus]